MLANCIGSFIEKYCMDRRKVSLPECNLKIQGIYKVSIDVEKLKNINDLWIFYGTAHISYIDSGVTLNMKNSIVGNAKVSFYPNAVNSEEMLPEVKFVTITKIS